MARTADEGGFDLIGVMDHFFQINSLGPPEQEMLEAYTTLGYLAANTSRARLITIVTGVVYRYPGVLAKTVNTLDVLSGGRGMLGIGAGWNEYEAKSLGIPFPPVPERFGMQPDTVHSTRLPATLSAAPGEASSRFDQRRRATCRAGPAAAGLLREIPGPRFH